MAVATRLPFRPASTGTSDDSTGGIGGEYPFAIGELEPIPAGIRKLLSDRSKLSLKVSGTRERHSDRIG
jgi:hypothetical protein